VGVDHTEACPARPTTRIQGTSSVTHGKPCTTAHSSKETTTAPAMHETSFSTETCTHALTTSAVWITKLWNRAPRLGGTCCRLAFITEWMHVHNSQLQMWFAKQGVFVQVPEECPQAVSNMVCACLDQQPANRPTAQHIFQVIQTSIQDTSCRSIV